MRTINPSRIYTRHEYCQILNEAYREADCRENVRVDIVFHYDGLNYSCFLKCSRRHRLIKRRHLVQ